MNITESTWHRGLGSKQGCLQHKLPRCSDTGCAAEADGAASSVSAGLSSRGARRARRHAPQEALYGDTASRCRGAWRVDTGSVLGIAAFRLRAISLFLSAAARRMCKVTCCFVRVRNLVWPPGGCQSLVLRAMYPETSGVSDGENCIKRNFIICGPLNRYS